MANRASVATSTDSCNCSTTVLLGFTVLLASLIYFVIRRFWRYNGGRLPPGPTGLPVVGVIPFLDKSMQISLTKWAKQYGSVYSMYLGPNLVVVLNDYDAIKTAYVDQADICLGRPPSVAFNQITRGDYGIIGAEGQFMRDQRALLVDIHKSIGQSGSRFEQLVLEEVDVLVKTFLDFAEQQQPFAPRQELALSLANVASSFLFSRRFPRYDEELARLVAEEQALPKVIAQAGVYEVFSFLRFVPVVNRGWQTFVGGEKVIHDFVQKQLDRVVAEYDPEKRQPQNEVEYLLKARFDKYGDDEAAAEQDRVLCMKNIIATVNIMCGPPQIPIPRALDWTILTFLHHPEVQRKCYLEIVTNVGTGKQIMWSDRTSLPYCEAVVLETMRRNNVTPSAVPHATMRETHLKGYFIPKRTMLIQNLWNARWEEKDFPEAKVFKPERFLTKTENGKQVLNENMVDRSLLFLTGPRACPGQPITRMTLFLIFVNLVQRVEFLPPPNVDVKMLPSLDEYEDGIETQPLLYKASARARVYPSVASPQKWDDAMH